MNGSDAYSEKTIMEVIKLRKEFPTAKGRAVRAVDGVSFTIERGEIFGLIGESGSGKTTVGKLIMRLIKPTGGKIFFNGEDVTGFDKARLGQYRREIQMIFQDPYASLNPRFRVREALEEPLIIHGIGKTREERKDIIVKALEEVKLDPASEFMPRYAHMLAGGQRQRTATARALILEPLLLVADEPVSMIDLSTRAEILHMMRDVQRKKGLTYLYITHDLSTARYFTDRLAVMYLGAVMEMGKTGDVIDNPRHPYTHALIEAVCEPVPGKVGTIKKLPIIGEIPSSEAIPKGCRFHPRCPCAQEDCARREPELKEMGPAHMAACFHPVESVY
ncbi:MAG: ABC transporter ATP-binding protein [Syntrophobacteraceae bacterium]